MPTGFRGAQSSPCMPIFNQIPYAVPLNIPLLRYTSGFILTSLSWSVPRSSSLKSCFLASRISSLPYYGMSQPPAMYLPHFIQYWLHNQNWPDVFVTKFICKIVETKYKIIDRSQRHKRLSRAHWTVRQLSTLKPIIIFFAVLVNGFVVYRLEW